MAHAWDCIHNQSQSGEKEDTEALKASEAKPHPGANPGSGTIQGIDYAKGKDFSAYTYMDPKQDIDFRIIDLSSRLKVMKEYLQSKVDEEDYHGIADTCMVLRAIESELKGLKFSR